MLNPSIVDLVNFRGRVLALVVPDCGLLCCVGNEGAILRGEAKRRVILDLAMGFLVGQGCCGSLCDHVPFEPRETCQHCNEHLAHTGAGIDALSAHVHQVQTDTCLLPFLDMG